MAEETDKAPTTNPQENPFNPASSQAVSLQPSDPAPLPAENATRSELISRARSFLSSPQIQGQDIFAKRRFLLDKGLNEAEIELLFRELPPQLPRVPPRTYPQPPPSSLLTLLVGFAKLFTWIAGGSAALVFLYHHYLLPRMLRTAEARRSLKVHQVNLLKRLNTSLHSLKESQTQSYATLPRIDPHKEPLIFAACHSLVDVLKEAETQKLEVKELPHVTLLRCAWEDFRKLPDCADSNPRTDELFQVLESRIPWLVSEEGITFERTTLWDVLSTCPVFEELSSQEGETAPVRWTYVSPKPTVPTPFASSLETLSKTALTYQPQSTTSPYQYTLQTMSELTGYISSNLYTPYRPPLLPGMTTPSTGEPADEFKKEIRSLKGLVLSRRTFMPSIPRPSIPSS
ncbi:hypothetical protein EV361DRAFT_895659 [Lentinula raphanica]|nr:hypothetical protein EV361DRAFT_895659 [Lentinula raphanica]